MKDLKSMPETKTADVLCELEVSQLAEVVGGITLWVGDGYCVSPIIWPPRPPLVTSSSVDPINQGLTQQYGTRLG
jgi:hypothetical protein